MLNLLINYLSFHYNFYILCSVLRQLSQLHYVFRLPTNRSQRLRWFGHVTRMNSESLVKGNYKLEPLGRRTAGRSKIRWEVDVMKDLELLKIKNWT